MFYSYQQRLIISCTIFFSLLQILKDTNNIRVHSFKKLKYSIGLMVIFNVFFQ